MGSYNYINITGTIVPDTSTLQTDVENEFKASFGTDLVVTPNTPQGVLITNEVLARASVVRNNATLANQINPNLSGGVFLDAVGALMAIERVPSFFSFVQAVTLTGVAGTVIDVTQTAQTPDGTLWSPIDPITLDVNGEGTGNFVALTPGPIAATPGTLITIVSGVVGWETVTNPNAAILGANEETDEVYRRRRKNLLAIQGTSTPVAIKSALYAIDQNVSLKFLENYTDNIEVIEGITLAPHSIYVCVGETNAASSTNGVTNNDIAAALVNKKNQGCGFNGSTSVMYTSSETGQIYTVLFDRPTEIPILIKATVRANSSISDIQTLVQNAILSYVTGQLDGEEGFTVGSDVSCFELAGAINEVQPTIFVSNLQTKLVSDPGYSNDLIPIAVNEIATTTRTSIIVEVI